MIQTESTQATLAAVRVRVAESERNYWNGLPHAAIFETYADYTEDICSLCQDSHD